MQLYYSLVLFFFITIPSEDKMLEAVNELRAEGCYCEGRYMPPVGPVKWNKKLYRSALSHAKDMQRHKYFRHIDSKGRDIGDRIEAAGYPWAVVGENIAKGQKYFPEVFKDWIDSGTHCKMLMNPKVNEMAIAKYGPYWVQHFGKQKDKNKKYGKGRNVRQE